MTILEMLKQIGIPTIYATIILFVLFLAMVCGFIAVGNMSPRGEKKETKAHAESAPAIHTAGQAVNQVPIAAIIAAVNEYRKNNN